MKKFSIGFNTKAEKKPDKKGRATLFGKTEIPVKSVVSVEFPNRSKSLAYYNDSFELNVGDLVYVEGMMEGIPGRVTEVNYSFKIKLSCYKKVIAVADTNVYGNFFLAGSHFVSFDKNAIPHSKVLTWFNAPEKDEEYAVGNDDEYIFSIDDLSAMKASKEIVERGREYNIENRVAYIEIDGNCGRAVVEGNSNYEVEFDYTKGEISNLKCSCFCSGICKHEVATMLRLKETLELIAENYENEYDDYFAVISKDVFMNMCLSKKVSGKISIRV